MLDTERLGQEAWDRAGGELGVAFPRALGLKIIGCALDECRKIFHRELGVDFPVDGFIDCANGHYRQLIDDGLEVKEGLHELIDYLDAHNIPKAVATSTGAQLASQKLAASGLHKRFDCVVSGDQVAKSKPAPDIFLQTATLLGVDPTHCMVLEDSPNGIRAAYAAGMMPVMVPDLVMPTEEISRLTSRICDTLHDCLVFMKEIRAALA